MLEEDSLGITDLTDLLKPSRIENHPDHIRLNDSFNRVITAVGFPRFIREGWLNALISSPGNFDLSLHVQPQSIQVVLERLNQELVKQKSDIIASELKGIVNPSLKLQYDDTLKMLERLQLGDEKLFNFGLYLNARAKNKQELELLSRKIESELNAIMIIPKTPFLKQQLALQSVLPLAQDKLKVSRNISSSALAACFPFTTAFLNIQEKGIMFGVNNENFIPIILNPYTFANYNGLILGSSGAGKSFFVKLYILRNLLNETRTFVIDPQGEYLELTKAHKGQIVEISRNSDSIINPLDLMGKDLGDKILSLMDLFKIMFTELNEVQKNILDKALYETYKRKGIVSENPETWKRSAPVLKDLYEVLDEEYKKNNSKMQQMTYEAVLNRLRIYATGSFSFLNNMTSIDFNNHLVTFNVKDMPEQVKPVIMFLLLDYLYEKVKKDKDRKLIVIDEAWSLLKHADQAEYIFKICKTARKFGTGLLIITQEVNDLLSSKAGHSVLANTSWKLLLRQEPAVIQELSEKFGLKESEQNFILTAVSGQGLLMAMNDRIPIKVIASEKE
ncbi:MAG: ATP-binding protein, partial [Candidatus Diapherotrites archaeon]|nr:ATP-binding protein [Candidatus Diapherotrites archaeon]